MEQIIKRYLLSLQYEKGLSPKTIEAYSSDLNKYSTYLRGKYNITDPNEIFMKHIKSFLKVFLKYYNKDQSSNLKSEYQATSINRYFSYEYLFIQKKNYELLVYWLLYMLCEEFFIFYCYFLFLYRMLFLKMYSKLK